MPSSFFLADDIINTKIKNSPTYIALFKSNPNRDNSGIEIDATSYERVAITFGTPSNGIVRNDVSVSFPQAMENWGVASYYGIYDSLTGGNLLFSDRFYYDDDIITGRIVTIPALQLQLQVV
jgi:hypothetical protein